MCDRCDRAAASNEPPWEGNYDRRELRRACEEIGVALPVEVRPASGWEAVEFGNWESPEYPDHKGAHLITVRGDLPYDAANESLLHELWHAREHEAEGEHYHAKYDLLELLFTYGKNPLEIEADEKGRELAERFKIAQPRDRTEGAS